MNIEKLKQELNEATAQRAEVELDRMISEHNKVANNSKESIKRYLANIATVPGTSANYSPSDSNMAEYVKHTMAAELLTKLKSELA